jgi:Flp pilus assembly secretin CpaC
MLGWILRRRLNMCRAAVAQSLTSLVLLSGSIAGSGAAFAADPVTSLGEPVTVILDQARVLKLPERTATLVVGNPLIADVSVQTGGLMVVTGKGHGVTNLIALDRAGNLLMDHPIEVQGPRDRLVVVYRGVDRESYSCTPNCERRVTLGDTQAYFAATLGQTGALTSQAQGVPAK